MKFVFVASAKADLRWFKRYYMSVFPDGRARADQQYIKAQMTVRGHPQAGHPSARFEGAREYVTPRTPFILIYRLRDDHIEVLRLLDSRSGT